MRSRLPPGRADIEVEAISLEIGRLTAVVPQSLRSCFAIATRGTAMAGATLDIEKIEPVVGCRDCGAESEQQGFPFVCTSCQSTCVDLLCGRESIVTSIEVAIRRGHGGLAGLAAPTRRERPCAE